MAHDPFGGISSDAAHGPRRYSLVDVFLWGTILANIAVAIMLPNLISSGLATMFYLVLLTRVFRKSPLGFLLFLPTSFLHFSAHNSLNAINAGAYVKKMGRLLCGSLSCFQMKIPLGSLNRNSKRLEFFVRLKISCFCCLDFFASASFKSKQIIAGFLVLYGNMTERFQLYAETKELELKVYGQ